jgi:hypothetical protein
MSNTLEFPEGVRLAQLDEIPGPEQARSDAWSKIQNADIRPGYVITQSDDPRFRFYVEANVDASEIWDVFRDLSQSLLGKTATLLIGEVDEEPFPVATASVEHALRVVQPHRYQLANDGFLQFGLLNQEGNEIREVFVAPTKHFKLWLTDTRTLRSVMREHGIPEVDALQFIDEFPRTTLRLRSDSGFLQNVDDLAASIKADLSRVRDA